MKKRKKKKVKKILKVKTSKTKKKKVLKMNFLTKNFIRNLNTKITIGRMRLVEIDYLSNNHRALSKEILKHNTDNNVTLLDNCVIGNSKPLFMYTNDKEGMFIPQHGFSIESESSKIMFNLIDNVVINSPEIIEICPYLNIGYQE